MGRGSGNWALLALIVSPLVAGFILLIAGVSGKKCVACAETVNLEAIKCKHCGAELAKVEKPQSYLDDAA